ncbi:MAG: hypothetical protein ACLRM9_03470 [Collinsella aerofaciens]
MLVYVRGAGDIATGVAARLVRAGVSVVMADIAVPTCIRRTISFCEAIRLGEVEVEGIRARLAQTSAEALEITEAGDVAVVVDPQAKMLGELKPAAVVDAILAKRNLGTTRDMAPTVIAVGPGLPRRSIATPWSRPCAGISWAVSLPKVHPSPTRACRALSLAMAKSVLSTAPPPACFGPTAQSATSCAPET